MRLRLLPSTIALGSLLLVSKSLGLAMAYLPGSWASGGSVVPLAVAALAAEPPHPAEAPHTEKESARPPVPSSPAAQAKQQASNETQPPPVTEEERKLLQDLRARRQEWEAKERISVEREGVVNAAEQRLIARAAELTALQARLEQLEKSRAERDDVNWAGLVKVYETMKPRDAASIFNDMDMPVLLQIADRMKEAKAALIFGAMQPDRARLLTAQLAVKRSRTTTMPDAAASAPAEGGSHS